jgi:hypothetical protein
MVDQHTVDPHPAHPFADLTYDIPAKDKLCADAYLKIIQHILYPFFRFFTQRILY